jgi:lipoprotein-anchoring transpeptidase ErfK/SrfK
MTSPVSLRRLIAAAVFVAIAAPAGAAYAPSMRLASLEIPADSTVAEWPPPPVRAEISLSNQTMHVYVGDNLAYTFKVSSGRRGYGTPAGTYKAQWLSRNHRSRKYDWAPMPWSVFFHRGYAVHGTKDLKRLGRPASHGCIRLHPDDARTFFKLVQANGKESTSITVVK